MTPERHERLMSLFDEICDLDPMGRESALAQLRAEDPELAVELEAMLAHDARPGALERPLLPAGDATDTLNAARICPECMQQTGLTTCPDDGFATVPAHLHHGPATDPLVGKIFEGRYRVERVLGRGGMGSVYEATHLTMQRPVALKVLLPALAGDLKQVRRFQYEARAASRLSHPHVLRVYDFGQSDHGELFLVSELLRGETLAALLEREGALPPARALGITIDILKALVCAHEEGIVHRDLKPENVYLTNVRGEGDFAKVLDFGLAKSVHADEDVSRLTRTGAVLGTPAYMSPEQAQDTEVDGRSDLYSLGILMFELLTGKLPFRADNVLDLLVAQLHETAPRLTLGDDPALIELEQLVADCLAKQKSARPASASVMQAQCEALLDRLRGVVTGSAAVSRPSDTQTVPASGPGSLPAPERTRVAGWVAVFAILAAATAGILVWAPWEDPASAGPAVAGAPPPPGNAASPSREPKPPAVQPEALARPKKAVEKAREEPVALVARAAESPLRRSRFALSETHIPWVRLESNPPRATVSDGKITLGTTPLEVAVDDTRKVTLRLRKHGARQITLKASEPLRRVTLKPRRSGPVKASLDAIPMKAVDLPDGL